MNANLFSLANEQLGFFTTKQAEMCGCLRQNLNYHIRRGHWTKVDRGLFRMTAAPETLAARYTRWVLWSRDRGDRPVGVISHASALFWYGVLAREPGEVDLTLP